MKVIIVYASNECISQRSQATTTHFELRHQHTFFLQKFLFIWNAALAPIMNIIIIIINSIQPLG